MRLVILDTANAVSEWAAKYVAKRINDFKPGPDKYFVLGLPTGEYDLNLRTNKYLKTVFSLLCTWDFEKHVFVPLSPLVVFKITKTNLTLATKVFSVSSNQIFIFTLSKG